MKAIKILLVLAASVAALVVVAALALALLVDPNQYKGYATDWVEARTGRAFAIEGDLELAFFPWLAVEGERVVMGHPREFDVDEPFATVERVSARIRLYPLLERRFEVGSVRVEGARINLVRGTDGTGNWEDFDTRSAPDAPDDAASRESLLDNLDIARIEIRDGVVRWHEEPGRPRYILDRIALTTGRVRAGDPVDVSLTVNVEDLSSARRFAVETRSLVGLEALRAAPDGAVVSLRDFALSLRAYDPANREIVSGAIDAQRFDALPNGAVDIAAARLDGRAAPTEAVPAGLDFGAGWSTLRFDPRAGALAVDGLVTRVAGVTAEWRLSARDIVDAPKIEGEVQVADAAIASALQTFGISLPAGADASTPSAIDGSASDRSSIDPGTIDAGTIDASARFRASLALTELDASRNADRSGAAADDEDAGGSARANGNAGRSGSEARPVVGPYRLDALDVDSFTLTVLGADLEGDAALGPDGVLRANVAMPEHTPSDELRAFAAEHAPDALDLVAIDRLGVSARVELGLADGRVAVRDFRAAVLGAEVFAALEALPRGANGGDRVLRGTVRTTPIDPARLSRLLGELMPAAISPDELGPLTLDTRFDYDLGARRIALDDISLDAFGLAATGRAVVAGLGEAVTASGQAAIAPFSPRALMTRFGQPIPATSDPTTLQRAALTARFEADGNGGRFRGIDLALDDTRITGEYAIDGLSNPAHAFTLAIDAVDVDRYLPPRKGDLEEDAEEDTRTAGDIELPTEALANLRVDGNVTVGDLRLAGLEFRAVETRIAVGDGRATLDSARASLYGGEFAGRFEVDTTEQPSLRLAGRATSLALDPIITALTGDANVSGTGDFDLDLAGTGATVLDNVETANGRVTFSMRDGAIEGFNLARALCVVYNTARRLPGPPERPSRTEYVSIGGTATVVDGVASSQDLLARTSFMDLTGAGHLALAEQRLDYSLEAKLTGSTAIPNCEEMDGLIGESLPLTLRGTVTDPTIRPDFSEIIQRRLRNALQDRLQDRLRDLLR